LPHPVDNDSVDVTLSGRSFDVRQPTLATVVNLTADALIDVWW